MSRVAKRDVCGICGSPNPEMVMALPATPPCDEYVQQKYANDHQESYPLDLYFCENCGLLQLCYLVDPQSVYENYIYETSVSPALVQHFEQYADEVVSSIKPAAGQLVIDIGCNDGTLLNCFRRLGMKVLGVEPAREIAKKVQASGIDVVPSLFSRKVAESIKEQHGPAAVITANNVLANVEDLPDFVEGVRHLLSEDGVFVFETGYGADVLQEHLVDTINHEHIYYLNTLPLVHLFKEHGLELIDMDRISSKGGSLHGVVQRSGGPRDVQTSVAEQTKVEISLGFDSAETYKKHAANIEGVRDELQVLLKDIKDSGKTTAVYGASAGVTTLLHYFDLGTDIEYLLDDNPGRFDLLSPGYHIPVMSSQEIYDRNPDYVLILAWRYAEPIAKRHAKFLEQGGHFIVPFPSVQVI